MKLQTYKDQDICLRWHTPKPNEQVQLACNTTMMAKPLKREYSGDSSALIRFLIKAEHTNPLEHVVFGFYIRGVSRSFLAQITRQRMASPTSGSQHYQDYRDYPMIVHPDYISEFTDPCLTDEQGHKITPLEAVAYDYEFLIDDCSIPAQEARQVLPNACAVNFMWTVNAVTLYWFLRKRCCNRNIDEMRYFADALKKLVATVWPEFAIACGPPCYTDTECNQGSMQCESGHWEAKDV